MMLNRKDNKILGSELKLKTIKKDPKFFQKLEFRELKQADSPTVPAEKMIINHEINLVLPMGSNKN